MGLPIGKLICASNENNVLTDFINTGIYDRRRNFFVTNSPSMDILISSNLERFLYELSGRNEEIIADLMEKLKKDGVYELNQDMKDKLKALYGSFSNQQDTLKAVKEMYEAADYLIDTHTAVAYNVYEEYKKNTGDDSVTVIASTASPFKFPKSINDALSFASKDTSELMMVLQLADKVNMKVPKEVLDLAKKLVRHKETCKKDEMRDTIKKFLNI
jgi:threonine synthase